MSLPAYDPIGMHAHGQHVELQSLSHSNSSTSSRKSSLRGGHTQQPNRSSTETEHPEDQPSQSVQHAEHSESPYKSPLTWWWLELGSMFLSIAFTIALFVILLHFRNQPFVDVWQKHFSVDPNTLASAFMTIAKAALLLPVAECISQLKWTYLTEEARRLDKLDMFVDAGKEPPHGQFLFLLSFPYREKVGRTISTPLRKIPMANAAAALGRTQIYDSGSGNGSPGQLSDVRMQGAVFDGLYALNRTIPFTCPTGNCTFWEFGSLGICSSCQDVTTTTLKDCHRSKMQTICKYHTPSGFTLKSSNVTDDPSGEKTHVDIMTTTNDTNPFYLAAFMLPESEAWEPTISECSLKWCGKIYNNASVINGTLFANVSQEVPVSGILSTKSGITTDDGPPGAALPPFSTLTAPSSFPNGTNFTLHSFGVLATQKFLGHLFNGSLDIASGVYSTSAANDYVMFQLYNRNNISDTLASIATSMTDYIRYGPNTTTADGLTFTEQQYVRIESPWLLLPLLLILSGAVMLGASMALTMRTNTLPWKGSSLPLFFRQEFGTRQFRDIENRAEHMQGRLESGPEGRLKFSSPSRGTILR